MAGYIQELPSPIGRLLLASDGQSLTGLWIAGQKYFGAGLDGHEEARELPVFIRTRRWLDSYFGGGQPDFLPPLAPQGSSFRQEVWQQLLQIPYGRLSTYGQIAARLETLLAKPVSARAVGGAAGHNPISLIIPCHRVVGADGSLTGYAGGLAVKAYLLALEGSVAADPARPGKCRINPV